MGLNNLKDDELEALDSKGLEALSDDALARLDAEDGQAPSESVTVEQPSITIPNPITETASAVGRLNEGLTKAAAKVAAPIAAPVDAAIKKFDEAHALPDIPFEQKTDEGTRHGSLLPELLTQAAGKAVGKVADFAADQLEIPEIARRPVKDVVAGAIQLGSGVGGAMRAFGFENVGTMVAKSAQETAKALMPPDPNILDQVAQGLGSMAAFMIPGVGISTSAGAVATVAPRLAMFLGTATSTVLEAGTEAGDVYNRVMDKTGDKNQASIAAGRSFWANIPLIHYTNKLGWAGDQASRLSRALESFLTEGLQEGSQELIGNFAANDPLMKGVLEAAFVGGITGGISGAVVHGPMSEVQQSAHGPEGTPPGAPPAAPAAPAAPELVGPGTGKPVHLVTEAEREGGGAHPLVAPPVTPPPVEPVAATPPEAPAVTAATPAPAPVQAPTPGTAQESAPLPTIPSPKEVAGKTKGSEGARAPKAPKAEKKGKKPKKGAEEAAAEPTPEEIDSEDAGAVSDEEVADAGLKTLAAEAIAENKQLAEKNHPMGSEITYSMGKGKKETGVVIGHSYSADGYSVKVRVGGKESVVNGNKILTGGKTVILGAEEDLGVPNKGEKSKAYTAAKEAIDNEKESAWKAKQKADDEVAVARLKELKALYDKAQAAPKEQRGAIAEEYAKLYQTFDEGAQETHYYSRDKIRETAGFTEMPPEALQFRQTDRATMDKSPEFKKVVKEAVEASSSRKEFREKLAQLVFERDIPVSRMLLGQLADTKVGAAMGIESRSIYGHDTLGGSEFNGEDQKKEIARVSEAMDKKLAELPISKEKGALLKKFAAKLEEILPDTQRKKGRKASLDDITAQSRKDMVEAARLGELSDEVVRDIIESGKVLSDGSSGWRGVVSFRTADNRIQVQRTWLGDFEVTKTDPRLMAKARALDLKQEGLPPSVNEKSRQRLVDWVREATVGWRGSEEHIAETEATIDNFTAPVEQLVKAARSWRHSGHHLAEDIMEMRGEGIIKELGWPTKPDAAYIQRHSGSIETFKEVIEHAPQYGKEKEEINRDKNAVSLLTSYDPVTNGEEVISEAKLEVKEAEKVLSEATKKADKERAQRDLQERKRNLKEITEVLAKPGAVNPDAKVIEYAPNEFETGDEVPAVTSVDDAVAQLEKAGYDLKTAKTLSTVFEGFRVLAKRAGVTASELFDRYGVRIVKGELEAQEGDKFLDQGKTLLRSWFGKSKVVDAKGKPLVVYHGTTSDFTIFDRRKANPESDFGAGFYFSNTQEDVAHNYAGEGPDLQNKIEHEAEGIFQRYWENAEDEPKYGTPEYKASMEKAREEARAKFSQHGGATMPVYLKMENPFVVGGPKETILDYQLVEDENGDIIDEKGPLIDFIQALRDEASRYEGGDVEALITKLLEQGGEVRAQDLYKLASETEGFGYFEDQNGRLVSKEIIRGALERAGFDGIIDNTVNVKFGSQKRIGKAMEGMRVGTVHYIAFESSQVKSALSSKFGKGESILEQGPVAPRSLEELRASWQALGINEFLSEKDGTITLHQIVVPKESRGQGVGTKAMEQLVAYADATGQRIVLTPDTTFGGSSKVRLREFYKRFDFTDNTGRRKDFRFRETMIRRPVGMESYGQSDARGRIRISLDREFSIELLENADLSTFLHESGHLYLEMLGDLAADPKASAELKSDLQTIHEWLGVKSREDITTAHHEKFARGFEAYLMEGKAPTTRLQIAFDQFRTWLSAIYKQLGALDVELTPEVRRVFDRILADDSEIAAETKGAEEALSRANRLKNETEAQGPPAQPQDAAPAAKAAVSEAKAKLKKAKEKAKPAAKQALPKAEDKGAVIEGVKRSILEPFAADARDLSDPAPRTWLKPAQLERYAKAGLLHPSEFTPTPTAIKAVAELQRLKGIMSKGYIDKPGLVEPKRLTLKGVLKGIADAGRFALFNLAPSGWMTDGRILFRVGTEDQTILNTFLPLAKSAGEPPKIDFLLKGAEKATDPITGVLGAQEGRDGKASYLLETEGGRHMTVAADLYNFFKERYPDAKLLAERPDAPIRVDEHGQTVGLLMPMRGSEEAKLYSAETGEQVDIKTKPGRAEVDAKMAEAETLRRKIEVSRRLLKDNQVQIDDIDAAPGEKKEGAIARSAQLQNERLKIEKEISDLETQVATVEEQAAALREQHGIEDIPASGLVRKRPKGGKGGGKGASSGEFAFDTPVELGGMENIKPFRMPELVRLAYELMGKVPEVGGLKSYNGYFKGGPLEQEIRLNPAIFQKPEQAAKTLAHEIGHLIDYLPDQTLKRGNLLGSLRSLHAHLANTYGVLKVTNKELRTELMAVTEYWRPYDKEASSASYLAYRKSARELYADAISMLFNSPGTLERMAPNFYREFFAGLDTKPAAKLAFFQLQAFLNSPELKIQEARELDRRAMYVNAEDLWKQKRAEKDARDNRYGEWVKQLVVDKNQKIIGEVDAAASRGIPLPRSRDPRYILEEMSLADNNNHAFLEEVDAKVIKTMTDAELSHLDMGDYLYLTRVADGDRQAFANPKGYTPEEAAKAIEFMKGRLGPERFARLQAAAGAFRDIIYKVAEEAVQVGAYNAKVFEEKIKPNKGTYAVFAVQEYLEDYVTAGVKEQVGTLKDIANPFTATVMKIVGLNRLIAKQKGAISVRDFLLARQEAEPAEVVARGDKLTQFRSKKGFGLLEMLEDGKPAAYYVDPYIAEAFQRKEAGTFHLAVKLLDSVFNGIFRPLYITFNLGFQMFSNPIRDFQRTRRNTYALIQNEGYAGSLKTMLVEYARSLGSAGRRAAGIHDNLVSEMIANKALDITFTDYTFDPDADQYTSVLRKMGLAAPQQDGLYDRASKMTVLKPLVKTLEAIRFMGNTFESISKIAGYRVLKADALATLDKAIAAEKDPATKARYQSERALLAEGKGEFAHELAYNTRNFVGTPNWRRKGTITSISNTIFPFSNIMVQSYRSDLDLATRPTTRTGFMLDMAITQLLPKLFMLFAAAGGAGDDLEEFFRKVSEYDKSNYIVIPVGWQEGANGTRKAVYARIPHDESGRLSAAVFWKMANAMKGDPQAFQQIIDFGAGQLPKLAPPLTIGATWVAFLSGKNPYDDFRGRPILPEKVYKAGGTYALGRMVQWTMNAMGLSSFATHDDTTKSTAESVLELTPAINRIIKVSDYGEKELEMRHLSEKQAEDARRSLDRGPAAKHYTVERYMLSQKVASGEASTGERARLARLNQYHQVYETYSNAIKRARAKGDPDKALHYTEKLDEILAKVVE